MYFVNYMVSFHLDKYTGVEWLDQYVISEE